jgi:hypothetical protein
LHWNFKLYYNQCSTNFTSLPQSRFHIPWMRDLSSGEVTLKDFRMVIYIVTLSKSSISIFAIVMSSYYLNGFVRNPFRFFKTISRGFWNVLFSQYRRHAGINWREVIDSRCLLLVYELLSWTMDVTECISAQYQSWLFQYTDTIELITEAVCNFRQDQFLFWRFVSNDWLIYKVQNPNKSLYIIR